MTTVNQTHTTQLHHLNSPYNTNEIYVPTYKIHCSNETLFN